MMKVHLGQSKDFLLVHCPFYQPISYYKSKTSLFFVYVISFCYYVFSILYSSNLNVTFDEIGGLRTRKGFGYQFLPVEPTIFTGPVEGLAPV